MGGPSFSPPPKKQRLYVYSWQGVRLVLSLVRLGNEWTSKFFSTEITTCSRLMLYLVKVGKEWAGPVFPHPLISKGCMCIHDRVRLMLSLVRVGRGWTSRVFLHPDNHLHKVYALACQGGERMGWPSFSRPPKKQRLFAYSWQGNVDTFTSPGGEWMGQPSFSPPR